MLKYQGQRPIRPTSAENECQCRADRRASSPSAEHFRVNAQLLDVKSGEISGAIGWMLRPGHHRGAGRDHQAHRRRLAARVESRRAGRLASRHVNAEATMNPCAAAIALRVLSFARAAADCDAAIAHFSRAIELEKGPEVRALAL